MANELTVHIMIINIIYKPKNNGVKSGSDRFHTNFEECGHISIKHNYVIYVGIYILFNSDVFKILFNL